MCKINVDFSKVVSKVKAQHAVNNCPYVPYGPLFDKLKEAGIPYSRLHDTGGAFGGSRYVDISNVFPNFDLDPNDPDSYDFAFTDRLLEELVKNGVKPFYRLGETIENYHDIKAYNIYPPKDPLKWAKICEGIIRHYNEGFADGYYYDIEYWEIWNEPDNEPDSALNQMWKGTKEEFFNLYSVTANYLKDKFPKLKIGGYASCGFYALINSDDTKWWVQNGKCSSRMEYFLEYFHDFMDFITSDEHKAPLDFFSWHTYADELCIPIMAKYVREELDRYGYTKAESILNEWTGITRKRGTLEDTAAVAAKMIAMQKSGIDLGMYYQASAISGYCGIFDPVHTDVFPTYYDFVAYNEIYKLNNEVYCESDGEKVYALAASDGNKKAIMISNTRAEDVDITISFADALTSGKMVHNIIDKLHMYDDILTKKIIDETEISITLSAFSVSLIEITE